MCVCVSERERVCVCVCVCVCVRACVYENVSECEHVFEAKQRKSQTWIIAVKRKKMLAWRENCSYRNFGKKVARLYLAVLE